MYNPHIGRFLQTDPIGYADGMKWYAYCGNNPIILADPMGLTVGSNAKLLRDFLIGTGGNRDRTYGSDDIETQEMMNAISVQQMREEFYSALDNGKTSTVSRYGTMEAYIDTVINPATADWSQTSFQVGGFEGATVVDNGNSTATFTIPNVAGANSLFLHAVPNAPWKTGPLSSITQTFKWTEPIITQSAINRLDSANISGIDTNGASFLLGFDSGSSSVSGWRKYK